MNNFSIVIPLFNEEKNIKNLVEEILLIFANIKKINYEILLVNDSSSDETSSVILELKKVKKNIIKIINNNKNFGQSFSIALGIKESLYNTIITLDGDGQNNPSDIPKLLNH